MAFYRHSFPEQRAGTPRSHVAEIIQATMVPDIASRCAWREQATVYVHAEVSSMVMRFGSADLWEHLILWLLSQYSHLLRTLAKNSSGRAIAIQLPS